MVGHHCSSYICCKRIWRPPQQMMKCRHNLTLVACLLTLFTPVENRVKCVFCFCLRRVTLLLNNNSIDKYLSSYAGDIGKNVTSWTVRCCCKQTGTCRQIGHPTFIQIRLRFSTFYAQTNAYTDNGQNFLQLFVIKYAPKPKWYEAAHSMKNVFSCYLLHPFKKKNLFSLFKYNNCIST